MLTTLLTLTTILLALCGLAIMHLAKAYTVLKSEYSELLEEAAQDDARIDSLIEEYSEYKFDAYIREQTLRNALEDAEMAFEQELKTKLAKLKIGYENRCIELEEELKGLNRELEHTKANSDSREQALIEALEALQEEQKNTIEGYETYTAEQAAEIASLNETINHKANRIAELKELLKKAVNHWNESTNQICELQDEIATVTEQRDHLMADRIEAIAHMKEQNETIAKLELEAYYAAEQELTEAIEAAEESPIHIDDKKGWVCIGNWSRLIVYKHNVYQPYCQSGLDGKIERTKRSDLTAKAQERYNALKAALRSL